MQGSRVVSWVSESTAFKSAFNEAKQSEDDLAYFEVVNDRFESGKASTLANSNPAHAIYIIKKLIDRAEEHVKVYSGCLQRVSSNPSHQGLMLYSDPYLIDSFEKFLRRCKHCSLQIVVENDVDYDENRSHPLLSMLTSLKSEHEVGSANIRRIDPDFLDRMKEHDTNRHLVMVDSKFIRIEISHEDSAAIVVFHDNETIGQLSDFFDRLLWKNASQVL